MKVYRNPLLDPLHIFMDEQNTGEIEARLPSSWQHAEASWRQMLLSQPPTLVEIIHWHGKIGRTRGAATWAAEFLAAPPSNFMKPSGRSVDGHWEELKSNEKLEELPAQSSS